MTWKNIRHPPGVSTVIERMVSTVGHTIDKNHSAWYLGFPLSQKEFFFFKLSLNVSVWLHRKGGLIRTTIDITTSLAEAMRTNVERVRSGSVSRPGLPGSFYWRCFVWRFTVQSWTSLGEVGAGVTRKDQYSRGNKCWGKDRYMNAAHLYVHHLRETKQQNWKECFSR
jgi:hypothetical protein